MTPFTRIRLRHRHHHLNLHHRFYRCYRFFTKQSMRYQEFFQGYAIAWHEGSRRGSEGENEGSRRGRPTTEVATCTENGRRLRDHLCFALKRKKLTRPLRRTYGKRDRHNRAIAE